MHTSSGLRVLGGVLGDLVWFLGGRRYGDRTLKTVCKLSLLGESVRVHRIGRGRNVIWAGSLLRPRLPRP